MKKASCIRGRETSSSNVALQKWVAKKLLKNKIKEKEKGKNVRDMGKWYHLNAYMVIMMIRGLHFNWNIDQISIMTSAKGGNREWYDRENEMENMGSEEHNSNKLKGKPRVAAENQCCSSSCNMYHESKHWSYLSQLHWVGEVS